MQTPSARSCALRMAVLLGAVAALDVAKPRLWCAMILALIPILTPAVITPYLVRSKS
jgi:hypothetical protein